MSVQNPPKTAQPHLGALTGLRFVAAAHVVIYHFARPILGDAPAFVRHVVATGHSGVSLFFVLSGFVLAYRYLDGSGGRPLDCRAFWSARIARLYPIYLLLLMVSLPFALPLSAMFGPGATPAHVASSLVYPMMALGAALTLTQAWLPGLHAIWNPPAWSLSAEAFFYALFPALAISLGRLAISNKRLVLSLTVLWILALSAPIANIALDPEGDGRLSSYQLWAGAMAASGHWVTAAVFTPVLRVPEFCFGVALGILFLRESRGGSCSQRRGALLSGVGAVGLCAGMAASSHIPYLLLNNGLFAPLYALLIYGLACGGGPVAWVLSRRSMVMLGEASYSLYLLQSPVLNWGSLLGLLTLEKTGLIVGISSARSFAAYGIVLIVLSIASLIRVERRFRPAVRRAAERRLAALALWVGTVAVRVQETSRRRLTYAPLA